MIANSFRSEACPLCYSVSIHKLGDISYGRPIHFSTSVIEIESIPELFQCHCCGSSFVQNIVLESMAVTLYSHGESGKRWSREPFQHQKPIEQIECLKRYFLSGCNVLDIGSNTGELLDYAKLLGCKTAGLEYSKSSRDILKEKGHAAYASMSAIDTKFDVITAFDLVEHLYDIPAFLLSCKKLLSDNGVLIVLTGNIGSFSAKRCKSQWWYVQYPEHIVFPSKKYFLERSGFLVSEWMATYAAQAYRHTWLQILKGLTRKLLLRERYTGLPSIGPDHVLAVLKNE